MMLNRFASTRRIAVATSLLVLGQAGMALSQQTPTAVTTPAAAPAAAAKDGDRSAGLKRHLWWNRTSIVEALKLSVHQREMMDQQFESRYEKEKAAREQVRGLRKEFDADLENGHYGAAREKVDKLAEAQKAAIENELNAKVDVLALLTEEQRQLLGKQRGKLLSSNWRGKGGGAAAMRRRLQRRGAAGAFKQKAGEE